MSDALDRRYNPLKLTSIVSGEIPAFAALRPDQIVSVNGEDRIRATQNNGVATDGLVVNSAKPILNGEDGWGRPTRNGMTFWVLYSGSVLVGDLVGPVSGQWEFSTDGRGYSVLKVDETNGIIECIASGPEEFAFFELIDDLQECGTPFVTCTRVVPDSVGPTPYWTRTEYPSTEQVSPGHHWRGIAFGVTGDPVSTRGEIVRAFRSGEAGAAGGEWIAVGTGHTSLFVKPTGDTASGETGPADVILDSGDCESATTNFMVTVTALEDLDAGELCISIWSNQKWNAIPLNAACVGDCLTEDEDGCLTIDNTVLAGTNLEPEGDCAIKLADSIEQRIEDLEACCAENRLCCDTLTGIVEDLIECCEDSRECCYESLLCCYDNQEAIDYINDYCCGEGNGGVPGAGDCDGSCVWRWNGSDWDLIVPCAGDASCDCDPPTDPGTGVGDIELTPCTGGGGGADCNDPWEFDCSAGAWTPVTMGLCDDPGEPPFTCDDEGETATYCCDDGTWSQP